ncbi:MAG: restriction endonuclease subunit S, partial [Bacteroidaceae bacterium]|nr:restriction endonuclease subunit S [Bacteroidaceae bacterium]
PLPPLDIQAQIVSECKKVDEEYNDSRMSIEEYKEKIAEVTNAVKGEKKRFGDECDINSGGTPSKKIVSYWSNGTIPWVKSEVCKGDFVYSTNEFITEEGLNHSSAKMFPEGTTLIALVGATKGKTAFLKFETTTNQNIAGLRVNNKNELNELFLFYMCRSSYNVFVKDLQQYDILNLSNIKSIHIPIPSLAEQQRIVSKIESYEAEIAKAKAVMEGCAERKKQILEKYLQ